MIVIDDGEVVLIMVDGYVGFCFMGGLMSVNDLLLWIELVCVLICDVVVKNVLVIGYCLGG